MARSFLDQYISATKDDPTLTSIHFYNASFEPYLGYNNTRAQLLAGIAAKPYLRGGT
jgi:hypothetical protein